MLVVVLKKKKHCKAHLEITQQPFDLIEHCMLSYTKRACTAVVGTHCRTGRVHHSFFWFQAFLLALNPITTTEVLGNATYFLSSAAFLFNSGFSLSIFMIKPTLFFIYTISYLKSMTDFAFAHKWCV